MTLAVIIGKIQSMATNYPGLRPVWKQNAEEERLIGVDITGQMASPVTWDEKNLRKWREWAWHIDGIYGVFLGIGPSASITCNKPSGNTSVLCGITSGIHPAWAPYYVRNVRLLRGSPMHRVLEDAGVPIHPESGKSAATTVVASFPVKAPKRAIVKDEMSALEQCEVWLRNKLNWTTHNPSVTVYYTEDEKEELVEWVYTHREYIGGMAFLPKSEIRLPLMPYVEVSQEEYEELMARFPEQIDFSKLYRYDGNKDNTEAATTLACLAAGQDC